MNITIYGWITRCDYDGLSGLQGMQISVDFRRRTYCRCSTRAARQSARVGQRALVEVEDAYGNCAAS